MFAIIGDIRRPDEVKVQLTLGGVQPWIRNDSADNIIN
jgi:hypothetical protein